MREDLTVIPDALEEERFGYFVLRTRANRADGRLAVTVVLENLGTGEKRTFASSAEVGRFLDEWSGMTVGNERFKAPSQDGDDEKPAN